MDYEASAMIQSQKVEEGREIDRLLKAEQDGTLTPIEKSLLRMKRHAEERESAEVIQLPLWPDAKRGTPNSFIRSALFAAIQSKDRVFINDQVLWSQDGITVKYMGMQLNQEDLTVCETLYHLGRQNPLGNQCSFTAHGILKALGLPTGGKNHAILHATIKRLNACSVEITYEGKTYFGSLIDGGFKDEVTSHYTIELNRKLIRLFGDSQWTAIDWQQRLELRRKPLAQALHAYFSSHRHPHPVKLVTLQELTGCRNAQKASFKRQCRTALDALVKVGFLESYKIEGDKVSVVRVHKASAYVLKEARS
jgi:TrfA protein